MATGRRTRRGAALAPLEDSSAPSNEQEEGQSTSGSGPNYTSYTTAASRLLLHMAPGGEACGGEGGGGGGAGVDGGLGGGDGGEGGEGGEGGGGGEDGGEGGGGAGGQLPEAQESDS